MELIFEDLSLRDGMQQLNIPKTYAKQKDIFQVLIGSNISSIEFRMLDSLEDANFLNECIKIIKREKIKKTITLLVILSDTYIELLEKIEGKEYVNIKILIPFSKEHFKYKIKVDKNQYGNKLKELYENKVKDRYNSFQAILEDVTSTSFKESEVFFNILIEECKLKFDYIVLADTKGQSIPKDMYEFVRWYVEKYPNQKFGIHCHNDMGLATANTLMAIEAGVKKVEGCFLGIGERAGNVALEQVYLILSQKYSYSCDLNKLLSILNRLKLIYEIPISCNSVLIGEGYNKHTSGIHQNAEYKSKGLYTFINDIEYESPLNPLSSKETIKKFYDEQEFVSFYRNSNKYIELEPEEIKIMYKISRESNGKTKY